MKLRINDTNIDWINSDSHYFFNPFHPSAQKLKDLALKLPFLKRHLYLWTSLEKKICLLSKEAFLSSAKAVNKNLQTNTTDKYLVSLPLFHVGGLSILARSFYGRFCYQHSSYTSWKIKVFQKDLVEKQISLCSLVPTQIYDLVRYQLKPPSTLRAVLVGGGSLSPVLYKKAIQLSWPILPCYGLTETSSQVASADLDSLNKKQFPKMKILDHIKTKKTESNIKIKSDSLLTGYFDIKLKKFYDPKDSTGWFELPDEIALDSGHLLVKGRKDEKIKILGENVDLKALSFLLEELSQNFSGEYQLVANPNERSNYQLDLLTDCFDFSKAFSLVENFNARVFPFERIKNIYYVSEIKKSVLFKIRQEKMRQQLGF